jgi:ATP/maltotriose-dependent transcriptional regulator MalT
VTSVSYRLVGRADELALGRQAIRDAVATVRHVVYVGGPGSGKTAILDALADSAQAEGALVLRAGGAQAEAELAFAGLSQLLRPALADAVDLPIAHQRVLDRVLRIGAPVQQADALVAMAVLALLELLSRDQPLTLVIDDMQWLDRATLDVLAFVGRRAVSLPMAVLAATRELTVILVPGATVTDVGPLDSADAQVVLDAHSAGLDPGVRQAILLQAEGNPLALVELPHALRHASADSVMADALPVTTRIQESFASRLDQLPDAARTLLLLAACLESGELAEVAAAARDVAVDLGELDHAQDLDLVRVDGQTVRFTHPMVASVVMARASASQRRAAHQALARTLAGQPARALRHRAAAATVADEELAAELETAAASLIGPGSLVGIAATLDRAAALSVDPTARARRLAAAADAARAAGRYGAAEARLARIDLSAVDPRTRIGIDSQRAWHQFDTGNVDTALSMLVAVLEQGAELGPQESIRPAALAGLARWLSGNRSYDPQLRRFLQPLDHVDETTPALAVMALAAADATRAPADVLAVLHAAAAGATAEGASRLGTVGTADTRAGELARLADAALVVDAIGPAQALARRASDQLRSLGSFGALATALATSCHAEFCAGDWATATQVAHEVLDIASVTGQQRQAAFVNANLAYIAAAQGRTDDAQQRRRQIGAWATPSHHRLIAALASWAQLVAALGAGESDLAAQTVAAMRPVGVTSSATSADRGALLAASACPDVVEALARAGQVREASDVVAWAEARVQRWPSATLSAQAAHARAVLTELTDAGPSDIDAAYEVAIEDSGIRAGFEQGRIGLLYGAWLRRSRRPSQARAYLSNAEELFAGLDATPWVQRARAELRATGQPRAASTASEQRMTAEPAVVAPPVSGPDPFADLTAQEREVVALAAEGLSNRQIAERLFLSPRTVGSHLYKAFPKLGVSNRAQLRAALDRRGES